MPTLEYTQSGEARADLQQANEYRWEVNSYSQPAANSGYANAKNVSSVFDASGYSVTSSQQNNSAMQTHFSRIPEEIQESIFACQRKDGWDLEDGKAIPLRACESALRFLETLIGEKPSIPMPDVSPSSLGAVALEWSKNRKHIAMFIFPDNGPVFYMSEQPGGIRSHGYEERYKGIIHVLNFFNS